VTGDITTAREHALRASELLDILDRRQRDAVEHLDDPMRRTEAMATGEITRFNRDQNWLLRVSAGHAQAALALAQTESFRGHREG
jgi:hypothetical protein